MGVRISWLILARKVDLARLAACACCASASACWVVSASACVRCTTRASSSCRCSRDLRLASCRLERIWPSEAIRPSMSPRVSRCCTLCRSPPAMARAASTARCKGSVRLRIMWAMKSSVSRQEAKAAAPTYQSWRRAASTASRTMASSAARASLASVASSRPARLTASRCGVMRAIGAFGAMALRSACRLVRRMPRSVSGSSLPTASIRPSEASRAACALGARLPLSTASTMPWTKRSYWVCAWPARPAFCAARPVACARKWSAAVW